MRLLGSLGFFLLMTGRREDAIGALERALALPGPVPDRARGQALYVLTIGADAVDDRDALHRMAKEAQAALERAAADPAEAAFARTVAATLGFFFTGGAVEAEQAIDEALEEVERAGGWLAALLRQLRGFARAMRGNLTGAVEDGEACLERFREIGDRWGIVQALELLGMVDTVQGRYELAEARIGEGLRCAWELRVPAELAVQLCRFAYLAMARGDLDRAEARLEQALAAAQGFGVGGAAAFAHAGLGLVAQRRGDLERAGRECQQALTLLQRHGARSPVGPLLLSWLGTVALQQGDLERAAALHGEVLEWSLRHGGSPSAVAGALVGSAAVIRAQGDPERAAVLLGAAAAARRSAGVPLPPGDRVDVDHTAAEALEALGEERFARALARGEALPLEEAVALVGQLAEEG